MKLRSKPMTKEQIKQYLHKLQLENFTPRADLATLQKLHDAHLKYIPYDNFDCLNSKITSLKREDMFNKLILHNRGGICFELNGLYAWLLESLGFNFVSFAGRFINKINVYQMRQHRNMCVTIDGKRYITDVGVNSESPRIPLLLEEQRVQSDGISQYKFTRDEFWGWLLWQKEKANRGNACWALPKNRSWKRITFSLRSGAMPIPIRPLTKKKSFPSSAKTATSPSAATF